MEADPDDVVTMAYRVLVADSSPSALKALHMAFQNSHYDLYTSADGSEVMGLLPQVNPDAIVLGLSLPHADGYELALQIRRMEEFARTPLVLLQAAFEEFDEARVIGLVYDEIVTKPFDSEELAHRIRTLISGTREPESLPEEPGPARVEDRVTEAAMPGTLHEHASDDMLRSQIKQEILAMERELEKRITARVKAEIKAWLQFDQPGEQEKP
ncbi:MAG: PleD family two-component system response regulator [Candidatus Aminicenantaceae bacterium]